MWDVGWGTRLMWADVGTCGQMLVSPALSICHLGPILALKVPITPF